MGGTFNFIYNGKRFFHLQKFKINFILKLGILHIAIITFANWAVQFPETTFGLSWTWAMWIFPMVVVATDLTVRLTNKHLARAIIGAAFIPAIIISSWLADWRIGVASGTAYFLGQLLDISVFQKIREKSEIWWAAPLISTLLANILDTYTFFAVAFHNSLDQFMSENWVKIATLDLIVKCIISTLVFLPLYGLLLMYLQSKIPNIVIRESLQKKTYPLNDE